MPYYVYILYSRSIDRYYIGSTADLSERLKKHNHIHKGFTSTGQPWELLYHETFETKSEAMQREKQLKTWKNRQRLETLISQGSG